MFHYTILIMSIFSLFSTGCFTASLQMVGILSFSLEHIEEIRFAKDGQISFLVTCTERNDFDYEPEWTGKCYVIGTQSLLEQYIRYAIETQHIVEGEKQKKENLPNQDYCWLHLDEENDSTKIYFYIHTFFDENAGWRIIPKEIMKKVADVNMLPLSLQEGSIVYSRKKDTDSSNDPQFSYTLDQKKYLVEINFSPPDGFDHYRKWWAKGLYGASWVVGPILDIPTLPIQIFLFFNNLPH